MANKQPKNGAYYTNLLHRIGKLNNPGKKRPTKMADGEKVIKGAFVASSLIAGALGFFAGRKK